MKWFLGLVVLGLGLAWLGSRGLDMGVGVMEHAVDVHQEAQRRVQAEPRVLEAVSTPRPAAPEPAARPSAPRLVVFPSVPKPVVAPVPVLTRDLVGLTMPEIEHRLGSPTGRVYGEQDEWWYDRQVLVFRQGRVVEVRLR